MKFIVVSLYHQKTRNLMAVTYSEIVKQQIKFPTTGEKEFYKIYLLLSNMTKEGDAPEEDKRLVGKEIELMALLMSKDLEFTLMFNQKSKDKNGDTVNQRIAKELNTEVNYVLLMMKNLRNKGALVVVDSIVEFSPELQQLREITKSNIKNYTAMPFEYTFAVKVVEDDEEEGNS